MALTSAHRTFATQRAFNAHFMLRENDVVPDRKLVVLWVEYFKVTGSVFRKKPPGRAQNTLGNHLRHCMVNSGHNLGDAIFKTK